MSNCCNATDIEICIRTIRHCDTMSKTLINILPLTHFNEMRRIPKNKQQQQQYTTKKKQIFIKNIPFPN